MQLIEAGIVARHRLAEPLNQLGLVHGDDAILLSLERDTTITDVDLSEQTGTTLPQLLPRLERMITAGHVVRIRNDLSNQSATHLTEKGWQAKHDLMVHWEMVEGELFRQKAKTKAKTKKRAKHTRWLGKRLCNFIAQN